MTDVTPSPAPSDPTPAAAAQPQPAVTAGAAAPNSDTAPGRGQPVVAGPAASVGGPIRAGVFNFGFLIGSIILLVLIIVAAFFVIHALSH